MPPTRGHLKLIVFFVLVAIAGVWWGFVQLDAARTLRDSVYTVDIDKARAIVAETLLVAVGVGLAGVLVRRITVARARSRELAQWAERVQAESKKYRALFEGSGDLLFIADPRTGAIVECNAHARERLGAPDSFGRLLDAGQLEVFASALRLEGDPATLTDLNLATLQGGPLIADARFSPIQIGGHSMVLVSLRDQTQQRALERELAMRERLSSLGLLTAGVAHEINNPLEGIGNYLTLLERADLPAEGRQRYLGLVQLGFGRIRDLVRDLLRFARPERVDARVDLAQVVDNACKLVALSASMKQVRVETRGLERPLAIRGDAGRLEQVVVNLLLNAGQAQRGTGSIRILARETDTPRTVELAIEDEGPGIPPEHLSRIFDPFFSTGGGSGLGLSVSYGIVRAHGGTIAAENRTEGGARFTLRLPLAPPDASA